MSATIDDLALDEQQYHAIKNYLDRKPQKNQYVGILRYILDNPFCSDADIYESCEQYMTKHVWSCSRKVIEACYPCRFVKMSFFHNDGNKSNRYAILKYKGE